MTLRRVGFLSVPLLCMLVCTSCSSKDKPSEPVADTTTAAAFEPGVPGGTIVQTHTVTAKVSDVNRKTRSVTLVPPGGKKTTIKCGPEVRNFDQIKKGDELTVTVAEKLVIAMADEPPAGQTDGGGVLVATAPKGSKPAALVAGTVQVNATVTAIDRERHRATLTFPDGTAKTIDVRPDVDLSKRKVGEQVTIRYTEATAIAVETPKKK